MMGGKRLVMVVDDDEMVRTSLKRLLRAMGYDIRTFSNAEQVLAHGRPQEPCCLILDLQLRDTTGLQFQRTLSARGIRIPIIFLTGHGDVASSVAAMKAGAIDFLPKPFNPDELLEAVQRAIALDARMLASNQHLQQLQTYFATLTPREREVFEGVVAGMLNKQIASELGITEKTVKIHRGRVMEKMYVESLAQLVRAAEVLEHALKPYHVHAKHGSCDARLNLNQK
jgi:FixJ family two-component response regulator